MLDLLARRMPLAASGLLATALGASAPQAPDGDPFDFRDPPATALVLVGPDGYRMVPVSPRGGVILGETVYPDLASIPFPVDLVDVFRPPTECPPVAEQAVAIGAKTLWLQLGIVSAEAAAIAEAGGLAVVMDRCTLIEHRRLGPGRG